eukprot:g5216.t1
MSSATDEKLQAEEKSIRPLLASANALQVPGEAQGWQIPTCVGPSPIPGAGNGRFAEVAAKKGDVVCRKVQRAMSSIGSISEIPLDSVITFAGEAELEQYVVLYEQKGYAREEVLKVFEHFIWSYDGKLACLNASTWTINHAGDASDGLNLAWEETAAETAEVGEKKEKEEGRGTIACVFTAAADIAVGVELRNDYRDFRQPQFYLDYCKKHGFTDVRTAVVKAVYGDEVEAC